MAAVDVNKVFSEWNINAKIAICFSLSTTIYWVERRERQYVSKKDSVNILHEIQKCRIYMELHGASYYKQFL